MFNPKKHQTLKNVIVIIIALGLVMAYVPLLFLDKNINYGYDPEELPVDKKNEQSNVTESVTSTELPLEIKR